MAPTAIMSEAAKTASGLAFSNCRIACWPLCFGEFALDDRGFFVEGPSPFSFSARW